MTRRLPDQQPDTVSFFIAGLPVPQGSKKAFVVGKRAVIVDDNAAALKPWRAKVGTAADIGVTFAGPVTVNLTFYMPSPKRPRWDVPAVKPDLDKLTRAVLDGLTDGGLIEDDARVVDMRLREFYADDHHSCGVHVEVTA